MLYTDEQGDYTASDARGRAERLQVHVSHCLACREAVAETRRTEVSDRFSARCGQTRSIPFGPAGWPLQEPLNERRHKPGPDTDIIPAVDQKADIAIARGVGRQHGTFVRRGSRPGREASAEDRSASRPARLQWRTPASRAASCCAAQYGLPGPARPVVPPSREPGAASDWPWARGLDRAGSVPRDASRR